jgi:hypothetical protein
MRDGAYVLYYHTGINPVHPLHEEAITNYFKSIRDGANVLYYHKGIHPVHPLHEEAATVGTAEAAGVRVIVDAAETTRHESNNKEDKENTKQMSSLPIWLLFLHQIFAMSQQAVPAVSIQPKRRLFKTCPKENVSHLQPGGRK